MTFSHFFYIHWSELPFPSPGDLPDPGIEPGFPTLEADTLTLKWSESCSVVSDSFWPHGLYNPWNSSGQNTGVGSLFLLHGIFPTQGSNPGLPHCRQILYQLSHKGSPELEGKVLIWDLFFLILIFSPINFVLNNILDPFPKFWYIVLISFLNFQFDFFLNYNFI